MKRSNPFHLLGGSSDDEKDEEDLDEGEKGDEEDDTAAPFLADKKSRKKQRKEERRAASKTCDNTKDMPEAELVRRVANLLKGKHSALCGRVSDAFEKGRWTDALVALAALRVSGQVPKLGAVQVGNL